jgi:hypothetical protein
MEKEEISLLCWESNPDFYAYGDNVDTIVLHALLLG